MRVCICMNIYIYIYMCVCIYIYIDHCAFTAGLYTMSHVTYEQVMSHKYLCTHTTSHATSEHNESCHYAMSTVRHVTYEQVESHK